MSPKTQPQRKKQEGAKAGFSAFALRCIIVIVPALVLAACGSAAKHPAVEHSSVAMPSKPVTATAPQRAYRGGAYYQDDGPGDQVPANLDQLADAAPKLEPLHRFANNPYTVFGTHYLPHKTLTPYRQRGIGSWYGRKFHGQRTSSGEPYDMYAMTAAHATLPIPSYARVTNIATGRAVIVRINDRGPFHSGRVVDLSYAAAYKLGYISAGSASVEVESITPEDMPMIAARQPKAPPSGATPLPSPDAAGPVAVARAITPVIPAAANPLQNESAVAAQAIPVHAEASGIYLQLGAFSGRDNADNFRVRIYQQLAWLNEAIQILARDNMFRLHLGPYRDRKEASAVAEKIRAELDFMPLVLNR